MTSSKKTGRQENDVIATKNSPYSVINKELIHFRLKKYKVSYRLQFKSVSLGQEGCKSMSVLVKLVSHIKVCTVFYVYTYHIC